MDLVQRYEHVFDYVSRTLPDDSVFSWIREETGRRGIPEIEITPAQGRLLNLLATLVGARRIVEVGTLGGYSTVWLARALPADGRLITLEIEPTHAELACDSVEQAGLSDRVEVIVGPALDSLQSLELDAPVDMVFIDADKPANRDYFDWALDHVRPGGLIIVDNVLLNARVVTNLDSPYYDTLRAFNNYVAQRFGDSTTIVPFYKDEERNLDALMIVRVPEPAR